MKHRRDAIVQDPVARYLDALEPARDPLLARMEGVAASRNEPISDPEVASFLAITAAAARPKRIVEVGTNIGYGAIVLARAAGPDARVVTLEISPDLCAIARGFIADAGLAGRIEVREGDARDTLAALEGPVDLAYVDCVKEHYLDYLAALAPKMPPGAVLVADNVLWRGFVAAADVPSADAARVAALRAFNTALVGHAGFRAVILPFGDGLAYAVKR